MNNTEVKEKSLSNTKENENFNSILACIILCSCTIPIILLIGGPPTIKIMFLAIMVIIFLSYLLYLSSKKNFPSLKDAAFLLTIVFLAPFFTYIFCVFLQTPNSDIVGTVDAWIGFSGSLLGGIITLYVLWMTIEYQNKKREEDQKLHEQERKEELATQYKPYLDIIKTVEEIPFGYGYNSIDFIVSPNYPHLSLATVFKIPEYYLEFFNIGRGVLCNLTFVSLKIINNDLFKHSYEFPKKHLCSIAPNQKFYLNLDFPSRLELKQEEYRNIKNVDITVNLVFTATDEFNYNHFKIDVEAIVSLSMSPEINYGKKVELNSNIVECSYNIKSLKSIMIILPKE